MKQIFLLLLFLNVVMATQAQSKASIESNITITYNKQKTLVYSNDKGELNVNVSPKDILKFKAAGLVRYSDFGAKGDGKTDDIDAIAAAHAFANQQNLSVKADAGANYYIGGKERTAVIQTNTDFGTASFIIDDTEVKNRNASVFTISSSLKPFKLKNISTLSKNQKKSILI